MNSSYWFSLWEMGPGFRPAFAAVARLSARRKVMLARKFLVEMAFDQANNSFLFRLNKQIKSYLPLVGWQCIVEERMRFFPLVPAMTGGSGAERAARCRCFFCTAVAIARRQKYNIRFSLFPSLACCCNATSAAALQPAAMAAFPPFSVPIPVHRVK